MIEKILPLPVKKNKFGKFVADISIDDYYRQICEEVLEAHEESFIAEYSAEKEDHEAEEIVDVITTCVTRLDIMHWYEDEFFSDYLNRIISDAEPDYSEPKDFYTDLSHAVTIAYSAAKFGYIINEEDGSDLINYLNVSDYDEETLLAEIIVMCIKRLESLGLDESTRQEFYQAVNEKNRKRGYFDKN